jgi:hypothetical protein
MKKQRQSIQFVAAFSEQCNNSRKRASKYRFSAIAFSLAKLQKRTLPQNKLDEKNI